VQEEALVTDTKMILHFLNDHKEERVCVMDEEGCFVGTIIYQDFLDQVVKDTGRNIEGLSSYAEFARILVGSINKDYVIFNENIWEEGRKYFRRFKIEAKLAPMLPVLNEGHQLLCFAWQDDEANKEIRMLDELVECSNALGFGDVFPECAGVTVYGCNELAYKLIMYLKREGIPVEVTEKMWGECSGWKEFYGCRNIPDYGRYTVYGEGLDTYGKTDMQRDSVSAEFECIDQIYEANICKGIIKDITVNSQEFLEELRGKRIGILGIDDSSLNVYDLLVRNGLDIDCFVAERMGEKVQRLFGKKVIGKAEALGSGNQLIIIDAKGKYSAWGGGETDLYHYCYGLRRNENYILFRDYMEVDDNGLRNVCSHYLVTQPEGRLVLIGEPHLCLKLCQSMEYENIGLMERVVYCDVLKIYVNKKIEIIQVDEEEISREDVCLLLLPRFYSYGRAHIYDYAETLKKRYMERIHELGVEDMLEYPANSIVFKEKAGLPEECGQQDFRVRKIVIGAINPFSGNVFFRGLMDGHPDVMMMDSCGLNTNLFSICTRLSGEKSTNVLPLLWEMLEKGFWVGTDKPWEDFRKEVFGAAMEEMLSVKDVFTSQELFVMLHIAYSKMWGKEITDISKMIIYWEPHRVPRAECESYAIWLDKAAESGCIVNMVRNAYIRAGSMLADLEKKGSIRPGAFLMVWEYPNPVKKEYKGWKRIVIKFEDIKLNPREELRKLCEQLELAWSDTLLETTEHGKKQYLENITGFDLTPVYRTHEKYFSEFDRFRLSLLLGPWQKRYGYPYVRCMDFSRRELQTIFSKGFRFEERILYVSDTEKIAAGIWIKNLINQRLWEIRREETIEAEDKELS